MQKTAEKGESAANAVKVSKMESIVLRDLKIAYGLNIEAEVITKFTSLKIFVLELNDLRGSDRQSFPQIISDLTQALGTLRSLECIELT